jgi:thiamine pyrophosphokinase
LETPKSLKALVVANGDPQDGPMVRRALETAPDAWVIAADGGARQAAYFGLTVHTLIGDMDSVEPPELERLTHSAEVLRHPPEKDETDLELALLLAAERGARWIRVLAALGDRLDQTLGNIYLMALPELRGLDVRLVAGKQEAWLMREGQSVVRGAAGDTVSIIPLSGEARGIRTENLYYPLRDETLRFGPARGISNVMQSAEAQISVREGIVLVVHTIGRA